MDIIARSILFLTSEGFIIPFSIIGFILYDRFIFGKALFILLFSMILNAFLKETFQVPLNPALGKVGWAFPSGHMMGVVVFWGWLAWEVKNTYFRIFAAVIYAGVAWALMHFGYHDYIDILGALGFGFLLLLLYGQILKLPWFKGKALPLVGLFLAAIGVPFIVLLPNLPHLYMALGALLGLGGGWYISEKKGAFGSAKRTKIIHLILSLIGVSVIYGIVMYFGSFLPPATKNFLQFFTIAFWVSYGALLIQRKLSF